jgi:hypothetical protein
VSERVGQWAGTQHNKVGGHAAQQSGRARSTTKWAGTQHNKVGGHAAQQSGTTSMAAKASAANVRRSETSGNGDHLSSIWALRKAAWHSVHTYDGDGGGACRVGALWGSL